MIINREGNITVITQEKQSIVTLVEKIEAVYDIHKNEHFIINITSLMPVSFQDIIEFLRISKRHRAAKKSFVIVSGKVNLDEMPDEIIVVPTLQEAHDIIEMEDMERDLGF